MSAPDSGTQDGDLSRQASDGTDLKELDGIVQDLANEKSPMAEIEEEKNDDPVSINIHLISHESFFNMENNEHLEKLAPKIQSAAPQRT